MDVDLGASPYYADGPSACEAIAAAGSDACPSVGVVQRCEPPDASSSTSSSKSSSKSSSTSSSSRKSPRRHGRGVERHARDARLGVLDETLTRPLASAPLGDRVASGAMECVKTSACAASLGSTARASASAAPWFLAEAYECRATSYATCRWAPAAACPESATVGAFAPSVAHANANANAVGSNPGIGLLPLEPSVADAGAVGGILTRASGYPSASGGGYGVAPRPETRGSSDENVATVHVVDWTRIVAAGAAAFAAAALVAVARARGGRVRGVASARNGVVRFGFGAASVTRAPRG